MKISLVGDHVEMRVVSRPADVVAGGFGNAQEQTAGAAEEASES